jgi:iron complex transport system substrate-binding protein
MTKTILSLLPSATEICYLLGLEDSLVGVTHECNWPPQVSMKPQVTSSIIPKNSTPAEIDRIVKTAASNNTLTQQIDLETIRKLRPDIVLTQDICKVCAVPKGHLSVALDYLGIDAEVISLDPFSLEDVFWNILTIGKATDTPEKAQRITDNLRQTLADLQARPPAERKKVFPLEWASPPYGAGHWVPEMIEAAGGIAVGCVKNANSTKFDWQDVALLEFDTVLFMPCGFGMEQALTQAEEIQGLAVFANVSEFYVANAGWYFSRPGPRLIEGIQALHAVLSGTECDPQVLKRLK